MPAVASTIGFLCAPLSPPGTEVCRILSVFNCRVVIFWFYVSLIFVIVFFNFWSSANSTDQQWAKPEKTFSCIFTIWPAEWLGSWVRRCCVSNRVNTIVACARSYVLLCNSRDFFSRKKHRRHLAHFGRGVRQRTFFRFQRDFSVSTGKYYAVNNVLTFVVGPGLFRRYIFKCQPFSKSRRCMYSFYRYIRFEQSCLSSSSYACKLELVGQQSSVYRKYSKIHPIDRYNIVCPWLQFKNTSHFLIY